MAHQPIENPTQAAHACRYISTGRPQAVPFFQGLVGPPHISFYTRGAFHVQGSGPSCLFQSAVPPPRPLATMEAVVEYVSTQRRGLSCPTLPSPALCPRSLQAQCRTGKARARSTHASVSEGNNQPHVHTKRSCCPILEANGALCSG